MDIGVVIKKYRKEAGMTQEEMVSGRWTGRFQKKAMKRLMNGH